MAAFQFKTYRTNFKNAHRGTPANGAGNGGRYEFKVNTTCRETLTKTVRNGGPYTGKFKIDGAENPFADCAQGQFSADSAEN